MHIHSSLKLEANVTVSFVKLFNCINPVNYGSIKNAMFDDDPMIQHLPVLSTFATDLIIESFQFHCCDLVEIAHDRDGFTIYDAIKPVMDL